MFGIHVHFCPHCKMEFECAAVSHCGKPAESCCYEKACYEKEEKRNEK